MTSPDAQGTLGCDKEGTALDGRREPILPLTVLCLTFLIFLLVIVGAYYAGFHSPMIYDSKAWINDKAGVFASHDLLEVIRIVPVRPLFMLTLYLNYLVTGMDPSFFRLTNAAMLAASGTMLTLLVMLVTEIPGLLPRLNRTQKRWISLCLGLLFIVHPLQTFVVLYVWQREAILACLFYFSSMAAYVALRTGRLGDTRGGYWLVSILFFLGLLSKENLATLPVVLVLMELTLFRQNIRQLLGRAAIIAAVTVPPAVLYAVSTACLHVKTSVHPPGIMHRLLQHYAESGLTAVQVLLTESRVCFSYLLSIVAPCPDVMHLVRAETVSSSLLDPPATLVSVLGVIGLIGTGIALCRRKPLLAFGLLFFFITLTPESFLIPQFLYFGYRPILPMAGLILASVELIGDITQWGRDHVSQRRLTMTFRVVFLAVFLFLVLATLHQARNWNPVRFWEKAYAALPHFSSRVEATPYVSVLISYGATLLNTGQPDRALQVLAKAVRIGCGGENSDVTSAPPRGASQKEPPNLTELLRGPCPEMKEDYHEAYNYLGMALSAMGKPLDAIDFYKAAIQLKPSSADAYNNWGEATLKLGNPTEAAKLFRKALTAQPSHAVATNNLGAVLLKSGQMEEATRLFRKAIKLRPDYGGALNNLGNVMLASGQVSEAIELYRKGIAATPDSPELRNNLGAALFRQGHAMEAREEFSAAVRLRPHFAKARVNLGMVELQLGELPEAVEDLTKAISLDPKLALAYVYRGQAHESAGHTADAVSDYTKAIEIAPHLVQALYRLARLNVKLHNRQSAIGYYENILRVAPREYGAHFELGSLYLSGSEFPQAVEHLRKALEIRPDALEARRRLEIAEQETKQQH